MKLFWIIVFALLIAAFTAPLNAQKLYTWSDEDGVLHITDQPPPKNVRIKNVMPYREKTPQELEQIQREREKSQQELEQAEKRWLPHVTRGGMIDRLLRETDSERKRFNH